MGCYDFLGLWGFYEFFLFLEFFGLFVWSCVVNWSSFLLLHLWKTLGWWQEIVVGPFFFFFFLRNKLTMSLSTGKKKMHQVIGMRPINSMKNIKWWQVSDGAKRLGYFKWCMMSDEWWKILIQTSPKHWSFLILLFFFWSITRIDTTLKWIVMNNSPIINGTKIDNSTLDVAWITSHNIQIFPTQRKK